jgi:hypothetical protein
MGPRVRGDDRENFSSYETPPSANPTAHSAKA